MVCITTLEALARLADKPEVETMFEKIPNDGITICTKLSKERVIDSIEKAPVVYEAGKVAQEKDMGVYVVARLEKHGWGNLFFETKPECRLTDKQLAESIARGRGANIFSNGVASFDA